MTMNSSLKNMAKTSIYGEGTKATAMSIEYKEYILELNANTFEMWTGDRKYRLTSSRYAQKHDGGALAQTVVRLLKKRSVWAGGEDLKGITIVIKYRRDVPEEIVDSIEEALSMEGFKTTEINKPDVGFENRASNRRVKNQETPTELVLEKGIVRAYFTNGDASLTKTTEIDNIETLRDMLDRAGVEMEDEGAAFAFIDSSEFDQDTFQLVPKMSESQNKQKVSKDPWKNRKSFSLNLNKG